MHVFNILKLFIERSFEALTHSFDDEHANTQQTLANI